MKPGRDVQFDYCWVVSRDGSLPGVMTTREEN